MYFRLRCEYPKDDDGGYYMAKDGIDFEGVKSWALGAKFSQPPPDPIRVELIPVEGYTGEPASMFDEYMCLMRKEMVAALLGCGVDNLDVYSAVLFDANRPAKFEYFAVNIIGLVAAADLRKSEWTNYDGEPRIDTQFDTLVIDRDKARGLMMFRLAEDTAVIVVHERVKRALEAATIPLLRFLPV